MKVNEQLLLIYVYYYSDNFQKNFSALLQRYKQTLYFVGLCDRNIYVHIITQR